ncbi:hypothetical protein LB505_005751 [Fusarium chuoi]|nr:hypothetical protein LB505_005751 [Fusarium chuoi]
MGWVTYRLTVTQADVCSFARHFVRKRLAEGVTMRKDMMQIHISNGMNEEELIQQAFISITRSSNDHTLLNHKSKRIPLPRRRGSKGHLFSQQSHLLGTDANTTISSSRYSRRSAHVAASSWSWFQASPSRGRYHQRLLRPRRNASRSGVLRCWSVTACLGR